MISVENISKSYGNRNVLEGISFKIEENGVYGFLGPNGAGKTTLLKILSGFRYPDEGRVKITGEYHVKTGYLPENSPVDNNLTVYEFLEFFASLKGLRGKKKKMEVEKVISLCSLKEVSDYRTGVLSKGYRKRTGLAQALLNSPGILLLDEPLSGLDPEQLISVRGIIKRTAKESIVIISSHNLKELELTSRWVFIMSRGKIKAETAVTPELDLEKFYLRSTDSVLL